MGYQSKELGFIVRFITIPHLLDHLMC